MTLGVTMGIRADQAMITWFGWGDVWGPRGRLRVEMNNFTVWKRTRVTRVTLVKDGGRYVHFVLFTPKYR